MQSSTYDSSLNSSTASGDPAAILAALAVGTVLGLIIYVITAIFLSKVFKKAGVEGWKAWVPVYNSWVMLEMGGQKGWLSLLLLTGFIPFLGFITTMVAFVFMCIAAYRIGLNFGKDGVFVLLYIFLTLVWVIWLAVDSKAVWKGKVPGTLEAKDSAPTAPSAPASPTV